MTYPYINQAFFFLDLVVLRLAGAFLTVFFFTFRTVFFLAAGFVEALDTRFFFATGIVISI